MWAPVNRLFFLLKSQVVRPRERSAEWRTLLDPPFLLARHLKNHIRLRCVSAEGRTRFGGISVATNVYRINTSVLLVVR